MARPSDPDGTSDSENKDAHPTMPYEMTADADRTQIRSAIGDSLPPGSAVVGDARDGSTVQQVGRYRVLERLGRGAMATVFKAFDPGIDRPLALKFLHPDLCVDEEHRSRFLREAKAAGGLSHPNIVTVFDVGEIQGRPYIAMELLDGTPLSEVIRPNEGLPIREVLLIGIQLARALDYAHSKGIFHRDIKPSNILRLKRDGVIKVTDFGIAHIAGQQSTQQTRVGTVLGTPQYMSPEQAMGLKVDGRSDLFSVGVVLYQLLTGHAPFEANSLVTLALRIAKEEPAAIEKLRSDGPPALRRVIERCLKKDPDKRFQSGSELAEALSRVIRDLNDAADTQGKPRMIPLRVKWTVVVAAVVAVTMALTATFITKRQYAAMMGQLIDNGASLAKFLAAENAVAALAEEWVTIDISVQEIMHTQDFHSIVIVDRKGVVRVTSEKDAAGKPYQEPAAATPVATRANGVVVRRFEAANGMTILDFEAPITFGPKEVGRVHLGVFEEPLSKVARVSAFSMVMLVLVTVAAVAIVTYLVADRYSKPIRLLAESMEEIAKGRYDYRIGEQRNDEFGQVYRGFDSMAQALQKRFEHDDSPPTA